MKNETKEQIDRVGLMMAFEDGTISEKEFFNLFSDLIKTGLVWQLQGFYGRTAKRLINEGYINNVGEINIEILNLIGE